MSSDSFKGYAVTSSSEWSSPQLIDFDPVPFGSHDIDVKIDYCGVCASDLLTARAGAGNDGWPETMYPVITGHEIVGKIVRMGELVDPSKFHIGQVVGADLVETYNSKYPDGSISFGGYANYKRCHQDLVFPIPSALPPEHAAPMLCAGLTVFSPLKAAGVGPGKRVGVVGIGGLGHFAVLFASAMGAEVTAISHSPRKQADAAKMGATGFIVTTNDVDWAEQNKSSLDLIISTTFANDMPLEKYLQLLDVGGQFALVGLGEQNLPEIPPGILVGANKAIVGSMIGSSRQMREMLEFAADKNIRAWIEVLPMKDAGMALRRLHQGDCSYRFVLKADI
ncbi:Alcohol dehydrogenase GroES-like domain-containing protein [Cladophialophora immunda]|nr:Alcohol dehydrogenase GroES-like domain-containing protein [Cladophialophora immunda]